MPQEAFLSRLYLISPPKISLVKFAHALEEAMGGGDVAAFQLRLKNVDDAEIRDAVKTLMPIVNAAGAAFILNDRVDIAKDMNTDGVHLGQEDTSLADARLALGEEKIIGISCHDSSHLAMEAGEHGADYVAFGAFYATKSKEPEQLAKYGTPTLDIIETWTKFTTVPCVAIGGLTPERAIPLVTAGADFVAAITAVWEHSDGPAAAVKEFNDALKQGLKARQTAA